MEIEEDSYKSEICCGVKADFEWDLKIVQFFLPCPCRISMDIRIIEFTPDRNKSIQHIQIIYIYT